jgi:hypothetical protein
MVGHSRKRTSKGLGHAHGYFISSLIKYLIRPTRTVPALKGTPEQSFESLRVRQTATAQMLAHLGRPVCAPGGTRTPDD